MSENKLCPVPWFLLPFWWLWKLVEAIMLITGRLLAVILGLVLMLVGVILSLTIIGAILGVPLLLSGCCWYFAGCSNA
jgi:hypothetical protein